MKLRMKKKSSNSENDRDVRLGMRRKMIQNLEINLLEEESEIRIDILIT
jgi:hypothetical protein